ncbi:MAG: hypothetical protein ACFFCZ_07590 [Promethearchaeota archaeon]
MKGRKFRHLGVLNCKNEWSLFIILVMVTALGAILVYSLPLERESITPEMTLIANRQSASIGERIWFTVNVQDPSNHRDVPGKVELTSLSSSKLLIQNLNHGRAIFDWVVDSHSRNEEVTFEAKYKPIAPYTSVSTTQTVIFNVIEYHRVETTLQLEVNRLAVRQKDDLEINVTIRSTEPVAPEDWIGGVIRLKDEITQHVLIEHQITEHKHSTIYSATLACCVPTMFFYQDTWNLTGEFVSSQTSQLQDSKSIVSLPLIRESFNLRLRSQSQQDGGIKLQGIVLGADPSGYLLQFGYYDPVMGPIILNEQSLSQRITYQTVYLDPAESISSVTFFTALLDPYYRQPLKWQNHSVFPPSSVITSDLSQVMFSGEQYAIPGQPYTVYLNGVPNQLSVFYLRPAESMVWLRLSPVILDRWGYGNLTMQIPHFYNDFIISKGVTRDYEWYVWCENSPNSILAQLPALPIEDQTKVPYSPSDDPIVTTTFLYSNSSRVGCPPYAGSTIQLWMTSLVNNEPVISGTIDLTEDLTGQHWLIPLVNGEATFLWTLNSSSEQWVHFTATFFEEAYANSSASYDVLTKDSWAWNGDIYTTTSISANSSRMWIGDPVSFTVTVTPDLWLMDTWEGSYVELLEAGKGVVLAQHTFDSSAITEIVTAEFNLSIYDWFDGARHTFQARFSGALILDLRPSTGYMEMPVRKYGFHAYWSANTTVIAQDEESAEFILDVQGDDPTGEQVNVTYTVNSLTTLWYSAILNGSFLSLTFSPTYLDPIGIYDFNVSIIVPELGLIETSNITSVVVEDPDGQITRTELYAEDTQVISGQAQFYVFVTRQADHSPVEVGDVRIILLNTSQFWDVALTDGWLQWTWTDDGNAPTGWLVFEALFTSYSGLLSSNATTHVYNSMLNPGSKSLIVQGSWNITEAKVTDWFRWEGQAQVNTPIIWDGWVELYDLDNFYTVAVTPIHTPTPETNVVWAWELRLPHFLSDIFPLGDQWNLEVRYSGSETNNLQSVSYMTPLQTADVYIISNVPSDVYYNTPFEISAQVYYGITNPEIITIGQIQMKLDGVPQGIQNLTIYDTNYTEDLTFVTENPGEHIILWTFSGHPYLPVRQETDSLILWIETYFFSCQSNSSIVYRGEWVSITGILKDANLAPAASQTVSLWLNTTYLMGVVTQTDGSFTAEWIVPEITAGDYYIEIRYNGDSSSGLIAAPSEYLPLRVKGTVTLTMVIPSQGIGNQTTWTYIEVRDSVTGEHITGGIIELYFGGPQLASYSCTSPMNLTWIIPVQNYSPGATLVQILFTNSLYYTDEITSESMIVWHETKFEQVQFDSSGQPGEPTQWSATVREVGGLNNVVYNMTVQLYFNNTLLDEKTTDVNGNVVFDTVFPDLPPGQYEWRLESISIATAYLLGTLYQNYTNIGEIATWIDLLIPSSCSVGEMLTGIAIVRENFTDQIVEGGTLDIWINGQLLIEFGTTNESFEWLCEEAGELIIQLMYSGNGFHLPSNRIIKINVSRMALVLEVYSNTTLLAPGDALYLFVATSAVPGLSATIESQNASGIIYQWRQIGLIEAWILIPTTFSGESFIIQIEVFNDYHYGNSTYRLPIGQQTGQNSPFLTIVNGTENIYWLDNDLELSIELMYETYNPFFAWKEGQTYIKDKKTGLIFGVKNITDMSSELGSREKICQGTIVCTLPVWLQESLEQYQNTTYEGLSLIVGYDGSNEYNLAPVEEEIKIQIQTQMGPQIVQLVLNETQPYTIIGETMFDSIPVAIRWEEDGIVCWQSSPTTKNVNFAFSYSPGTHNLTFVSVDQNNQITRLYVTVVVKYTSPEFHEVQITPQGNGIYVSVRVTDVTPINIWLVFSGTWNVSLNPTDQADSYAAHVPLSPGTYSGRLVAQNSYGIVTEHILSVWTVSEIIDNNNTNSSEIETPNPPKQSLEDQNFLNKLLSPEYIVLALILIGIAIGIIIVKKKTTKTPPIIPIVKQSEQTSNE